MLLGLDLAIVPWIFVDETQFANPAVIFIRTSIRCCCIFHPATTSEEARSPSLWQNTRRVVLPLLLSYKTATIYLTSSKTTT